ATEAIRNSNGVVAVWRGDGEGPGNVALERQGAVPIRSSQELAHLLNAKSLKAPTPVRNPVQLDFLDNV
ncbi:MAG: hypothetical protein WCC01_03240, partial [Acidimicrobiia bacterium]